MLKSLCGKFPCPELCVRSCHCPAGRERAAWLLAQQRNRRLVLGGGFRRPPGTPQFKHNIGALNAPIHRRSKAKPSQARLFPAAEKAPLWMRVRSGSEGLLFDPYIGHKEASRRADKYWTANVRKSFPSLLAFLVIILFMSLVVFFGVIAFDADFIPGYKPEPGYSPPYWLEDNYGERR